MALGWDLAVTRLRPASSPVEVPEIKDNKEVTGEEANNWAVVTWGQVPVPVVDATQLLVTTQAVPAAEHTAVLVVPV